MLVVVNAVSQDESDSIESNVVEQDEVVADSASDSDILKDSEIYDGVFRNTMSDDELPDWIKNHVSIVPVFYRPGSYGSGFTDDIGNATAPWNANGSSGGANSGEGENGSGISGNGSNPNSDAVLGSDHDTAPGIGGDASPSISAASPSDSGSSAANPNAYEIDEHDNVASKSSDHLQLGIICIVALLLLIIGYKRQKDKEEEE